MKVFAAAAVVVALGLPVCAQAQWADPGGSHARAAAVTGPAGSSALLTVSSNAVVARPEAVSPPAGDPAVTPPAGNTNVTVRVGSASAIPGHRPPVGNSNVTVRIGPPGTNVPVRIGAPTPVGNAPRIPPPATNVNVVVRVDPSQATDRPPLPH